MERFNFDLPWERQYVEYRSDREWRRIYRFLRRGYWHVTGPEGWDGIRKSQAIRANEGAFPMSWPQTDMSFGYSHKCVALFDFVTPSEEQFIRMFQHVWDVLAHHRPSILLQLDRRRLRAKVIPNTHVCDWERGCGRKVDGKVFGLVPYCEVWYPQEISFLAITEVYRLVTPEFGVIRAQRIDKNVTVPPDPPTPAPQWRPDMTQAEAVQICWTGLYSQHPIPAEICRLAGPGWESLLSR